MFSILRRVEAKAEAEMVEINSSWCLTALAINESVLPHVNYKKSVLLWWSSVVLVYCTRNYNSLKCIAQDREGGNWFSSDVINIIFFA